MSLDASLAQFLAGRSHGLPWEVGMYDIRTIFTAGYTAGRAVPPGTTESLESIRESMRACGVASVAVPSANEANVDLRGPCSAEAAGSSPVVGSITAEDIYREYPRKQGRLAALKAITKVERLVRDGDHGGWAYLMKQTKAYAAAVATWPENERQYIPMASTFYNQGRYEDDQKLWRRDAGTSQFRDTK